MIAGLRRHHRTMVTMLGVLVAYLFTWAIVARKTTPPVNSPPGITPTRP